jgi:CubicO group peptidase (beta-lactamase class C family)
MTSRKVNREEEEEEHLFDDLDLDRNPPPKDPRVDELVNEHMHELGARLPKGKDRERVPGAAVAVIQGMKLVHLNCYGYANLETAAKITPATIFDLGSLSKQFTAIAVLDLVNRGRIDLKDPLSKFFKGFPRYADAVTVEDLIHHTSGLPDYTDIYVASRRAEKDWYDAAMARPDEWYPQMRPGKREISNKEVIEWIATQTLLPAAPDTEFNYCNSGYVVLAALVEKVARRRFSEHLRKKLFTQFDMNDTYVFDEACRFSSDAPEVVNHARCYNLVEGEGFVPVGYTPMNFTNGDGNVHSTIVDLAKWAKLLTYLDDELRKTLWAPVQLKSRKHVNYGWGWNLLSEKYEGKVKGKPGTVKYESRAEFHHGVWLAWRSNMARGSRWPVPKPGKPVDPKTRESLDIIVLSNTNLFKSGIMTQMTQSISRVYWGPLKKDNIMNYF